MANTKRRNPGFKGADPGGLTGEQRARLAGWPQSMGRAEGVPPARVIVGGANLLVRPVVARTLPDLVRALVPGRGGKPGQRGRPRREHADRVALALRAVLAERAGESTFAGAVKADLIAAGHGDDAARLARMVLQCQRERRWLDDARMTEPLLQYAPHVLAGKPLFVYRIRLELAPPARGPTFGGADSAAGAALVEGPALPAQRAGAAAAARSPILDTAAWREVEFIHVALEPAGELELNSTLEHGDKPDLSDAEPVTLKSQR